MKYAAEPNGKRKKNAKQGSSEISTAKRIGYRIYGILYSMFRLMPVDRKRVYFIMTHDSSNEGNCGVMKSCIEKHRKNFDCRTLTRAQTNSKKPWSMLKFLIGSPWMLARSAYVFMDNAFLPLAYLKLRPQTKIVQLWHGTGTIKKFGQHVNTGELGQLEKRANRSISLLPVSSDATRNLYAECFGIDRKNVKVLGLPRTDCFFDNTFAARARKRLEQDYPVIAGKRFILYMPTFRDNTLNREKLPLDMELLRQLPMDICFGLRLHPVLQTGFATGDDFDSRIIDLSGYEGVNTLLGAADILVTDYSSVIYEYGILDRPMIFFAYDLEQFEREGRGFYRSYRELVPGPVVHDTKELLGCIYTGLFEDEKRAGFIKEAYAFRDGRSAERIYEEVFRH